MIPGVNVFDVGWVTLTLTHHSRRRGSRRISGRHRVGLDVELNLEGGKASWQNKKGPKVNNRWRWEENPTYSRPLTKGLAQLILDHPKGGLKAKFILFDDTEVHKVSNKVITVSDSPHRDHLYVRFCAPPYFYPKVKLYQCES
jgi:hypothetical protein